MTLPSVAALAQISDQNWAALGQRLRELGLTMEMARRAANVATGHDWLLRRPMQLWHLKRRNDPVAAAMRAFLFHDAVPESAMNDALGSLVPLLLEAEVLERGPSNQLQARYALAVAGRHFVLSDLQGARGDAVMGGAYTTMRLCHAGTPDRRVGRALDLGCGAGTAAIVLADEAEHVVGTDINPRAIALSRINAQINAVSNVEFVEGSLFEPVSDERFDWVVSAPPYIVQPRGASPTVFLHGGARGDELVLQLLRELPQHLRPRGRGIVLVTWPEVAGDAVTQRVEKALEGFAGTGLLLAGGKLDPDDYSVGCATLFHDTLGEEFERAATELREHLAETEIQGFLQSWVVLEAAAEGRGLGFHCSELKPQGVDAMTSADMTLQLSAIELSSASDGELLAANLGASEGLSLHSSEDGKVEVQLGAVRADVTIDPATVQLFSAVHDAPTVGEGLRYAAEQLGAPFDDFAADGLGAVRTMLRLGLLSGGG